MNDKTDPSRGYVPPEETTENSAEITERMRENRAIVLMDNMVGRLLRNFVGTSEELEKIKEDTKKTLSGFVSEFVNVEMENQAKLESSYLNPMTGVLNGRGAERIFDLLRLEQIRKEEDGRIVAVRLDLDNFKKVNDLGDHALGDAVLKKVAEKLRSPDILIHFSGDEFGLILFNVKPTTAEDGGALSHDNTAKMALSRIIEKIESGCQEVIDKEAEIKPELKGLAVSASVGYKIIDPTEIEKIGFADADALADKASTFSKKLKGTDLPASKRIVGVDENIKDIMERLNITEAELGVSIFLKQIDRALCEIKEQTTPETQVEIDRKIEELKEIIKNGFSA